MCYKYFLLFTYFIKTIVSLEQLNGWNYINLHCRDNDNKPVDWWYIYKPPAELIPFRELGRNFIFVTSEKAGRWQHSSSQITSNSMLQHTVAPMFRPTYTDYLAVISYEERRGNGSRPTSLGVLMADEVGGAWIGHTVPGLIDLTKDRPSFPVNEMANGHLLVCLSLDLIALNQMAELLKQMDLRFSNIQIPPLLRGYLPEWNYLHFTNYKHGSPSKTSLDFLSKNNSLRVKMMIRKPEGATCPYSQFAKSMNLVLDIYGHHGHKLPYCFNNYSVRKIDRISMKSTDYVHYINSEQDRSSFAVSTAAHWQKTGRSGRDQYWTCTGPTDDLSESGGILVCVNDYNVWQTFDNFKVNEPQC